MSRRGLWKSGLTVLYVVTSWMLVNFPKGQAVADEKKSILDLSKHCPISQGFDPISELRKDPSRESLVYSPSPGNRVITSDAMMKFSGTLEVFYARGEYDTVIKYATSCRGPSQSHWDGKRSLVLARALQKTGHWDLAWSVLQAMKKTPTAVRAIIDIAIDAQDLPRARQAVALHTDEPAPGEASGSLKHLRDVKWLELKQSPEYKNSLAHFEKHLAEEKERRQYRESILRRTGDYGGPSFQRGGAVGGEYAVGIWRNDEGLCAGQSTGRGSGWLMPCGIAVGMPDFSDSVYYFELQTAAILAAGGHGLFVAGGPLVGAGLRFDGDRFIGLQYSASLTLPFLIPPSPYIRVFKSRVADVPDSTEIGLFVKVPILLWLRLL